MYLKKKKPFLLSAMAAVIKKNGKNPLAVLKVRLLMHFRSIEFIGRLHPSRS